MYIDDGFDIIKKIARKYKNKLKSIVDIRMCIWVIFQRCKVVLEWCEIYLNMEDENNYFEEYLTKNKLNLKTKKHSFDY